MAKAWKEREEVGGMTGITYPVCAALSAGGKSRAQCAAACADRPTHSW